MVRVYKPYTPPSELQLKNYQKDGIKFLQSHWEAILADEMGLGKTVTMLMAIKDWVDKQNSTPYGKNCLIITPASLQWNWIREIQCWLGEDNFKFLFPGCGHHHIYLDTYDHLDVWTYQQRG